MRVIVPTIKKSDIRIRLTMALWGAVAFVFMSLLACVMYIGDKITVDIHVNVNIEYLLKFSAALASIVSVIFTYIMSSEQTNRSKKQELYQTLETQSMELFRFEIDHSDLVRLLWFSSSDEFEQASETERYCVKQYICQILNLFEMAVNFRQQGILPKDVFGSWVIWMWELCGSGNFQNLWLDEDEDFPLNYTEDMARLLSSAVSIARETGTTDPKLKFFQLVENTFDCPEVGNWLERDIRAIHRQAKPHGHDGTN